MLLTVFTPTFNRAYTLPQLYASLVQQAKGDLEWLVVDDGSTDGTEELVLSWQAQSDVRIRYIKQENQGKHVAHNLGALLAQGDYFVCVDSDDWLVPDAVARLLDLLREAPDAQSGFVFPSLQSGPDDGERQAWPIPDGRQVRLADIRMAWGFSGETTIVFPTAGLRRHPFPVFPGEKFPYEDIAYLAMGEDLRFVAYANPVVAFAYREDGLTNDVFAKWVQNPEGALAMLRKRYEVSGEYDRMTSTKQKVKAELNRIGLMAALGRGIMGGSPSVPLTVLLALPGMLFSLVRFKGAERRSA